MQKLDGKDWRHENLLSLAGVYKPKAKIEESSLPVALVQYLADYPHIRKVVLRLDNDHTGKLAAETIKTLLSKKYAVAVEIQPPLQGKRLQRLFMYAARTSHYQAKRKEQRTMKTYEVTITETLQKTVEVEANSREEAERQVEQRWNNSEYILDADSFVGVDFSARTNERSRDYER